MKAVATMIWIARTIANLQHRGASIAEHTYVVGGAVRDHLLGRPIKDVDIVIDSKATRGFDSAALGKALQRHAPLGMTENTYGVAILSFHAPFRIVLDGVEYDLEGEVVEIATAREESYGGASGKGYKPSEVQPASIGADVYRREFTFNTLMWRMSNLINGPDDAEVIDLSGRGLDDLRQGRMSTPSDADKTFQDDPTRMLRAIKFAARYNWQVEDSVADAIRRNAMELLNVPENAVSELLVRDVFSYGPAAVELLDDLDLSEPVAHFYEIRSFRARMDSVLKNMDPKAVLELFDAGLPFEEPWASIDADQDRLRDAIRRASDPRLLIDACQQPSKFLGDKNWFTRTATAFSVTKREMKTFNETVKSIVINALLDDPDAVLSRNEFTDYVEQVLENSLR